MTSEPALNVDGPVDPLLSAQDSETHLNPADDVVPLSKNAQKRLLKEARRAEQRVERKAKDRLLKKEKQRVKAEKRAAGEPLDEGEERGKKRAMIQRPKRFDARVVIDLGFDDKMNDKEVKSLCSQLSFTYGANRKAMRSFSTILHTSLDGRTKGLLDSLQKQDYLRWRGVDWWTGSYEYLWKEGDPGDCRNYETVEPLGADTTSETSTKRQRRRIREPVRHTCVQQNVIYLTADSEEEISELKEGETYIIGGLVDHNRYKNLCLNKAAAQGVRTARLPIGTYIANLQSRKVLTVNQVFEIMLQWLEFRDWEKAIMAVMPQRKFKEGKKKWDVGGDGDESDVKEEAAGDRSDEDVDAPPNEHSDGDLDGEISDGCEGSHVKGGAIQTG